MIEVQPFKLFHVDLLRAQGVQLAQLREISHVPATYDRVPPGPAVTAFLGGRIILCGGIAVKAPARGECWALLSEHASHHMVWLHYAVKRFISMQPWKRLEATVEDGFEQGCRWVQLLGFEFEGKMRCYGPNGETHVRYAKVGT